jgi:hypothetical protein
MTVYCVMLTSGYHLSGVDAIFSKKDDAEKYIKNREEDLILNSTYIEEFEVDEELSKYYWEKLL